MREASVWILRVCPLLLLCCSDPVFCQLPAGHRKGPQSRGPQQEVAATAGGGGHGGAQGGSWGAWGPWASCSRTCGRGVREQSRPCLPVYTPPSLRPSPDSRRPVAGGRVQDPRYVLSALQPAAGGQEEPGATRPQTNGSTRGGELRTLGRGREDWPAGRRPPGHFTPGQYGYGRVRAAAQPVTETAFRPGASPLQRQRRSPAAESFQPAQPRPHGGHRSNSWETASGNNNNNRQQQQHLYGRTYQQPWAPRPKSTPVWAPLYQPGSAYWQPQQESQPSGAQLHQERPYDPLPTSACAGEHVHYRLCVNNACPSSSKNIRAVQCSSFNKQPFMGRLYEWEPFTEVPGEHHCELNCRALGFRFYVRLSDRVTDGTPCGDNETALCVAGKCAVRR